jgi:hypothetical protein
MSIYSRIYYNLCQNRSQLVEQWKPGSNLHRHHIVPKHSGGTDDVSNFSYLTIREHIIAHFLLWKIYRNPNDLRSMKMLSAKLTSKQRSIIGKWCCDNKIGFHGATREQRLEWNRKGIKTQEFKGNKNSFWWWSTEEGRKYRASLGGKASIEAGNNTEWIYWMLPEGIKQRASMGGKSHKGKRCMYKPGDKSFKRVKSEDIQTYLNEGYIFGSPIPSKNQHSS